MTSRYGTSSQLDTYLEGRIMLSTYVIHVFMWRNLHLETHRYYDVST